MAQIEVLADLDETPPNTPEWYELRRLGWGGSDAAALAGVSPYRGQTPYAKWVEKMSESSPADPEAEPEYLTWGKLLEAPVREEFERRTELEVVRFPKMVRSIPHPFMLANVDGLIVDRDRPENVANITGIYEGKTSRFDWASDGTVTIPVQYAVQGYHYMAVLELDIVHYACLVGGQKLVVAELERNDKLIEDLIAIEAAMWQKVVDGIPPAAEAGDIDTLRRHWTPEAGKSIELTAELAMSLKARAQLKSTITSAEDDVKAIDAALMEFMGDAEEATWRNQTAITWKQDQKGRLKTKELAAAYPDIAKQFTGEPSRRFIPKEIAS